MCRVCAGAVPQTQYPSCASSDAGAPSLASEASAPICQLPECVDSTDYSGALGTCSAPIGPGPCILPEGPSECPVLCDTCPLPFPSPTPVSPPGGAALYVCDDGNRIAIYLYSDVA
eukprot:scaffold6270_cov215-Prasinococcus_capsulatus_cf.AAC.1